MQLSQQAKFSLAAWAVAGAVFYVWQIRPDLQKGASAPVTGIRVADRQPLQGGPVSAQEAGRSAR